MVGGSLQVVIHELGHLVFGLFSGYRFLSFQAFGFVIVRENGHFRVKKFNLNGAMGQCLMMPPENRVGEVPVVAYNAGGIVFNVIATVICGVLALEGHSSFENIFFAVTAYIGLYMVVINGIPMCVGGLPNDGYNILRLKKNPKSRKAFVNMLKLSAQVKDGIRPKDLPRSYFDGFEEVDFNEPLQVNVLMAYVAYLFDRGDYTECKSIYRDIVDKEKRVKIFVLDSKCELACLMFMEGDVANAKNMLDEADLKLVRQMSKTISSKQRFLCLYALYVDGDIEGAVKIYEAVKTAPDKYLIKGEVETDLEIMADQLRRFEAF